MVNVRLEANKTMYEVSLATDRLNIVNTKPKTTIFIEMSMVPPLYSGCVWVGSLRPVGI